MKKTKLAYYSAIFVVGLIIFTFCSLLVYITDDWHFKFVFQYFDPIGHETRVSGLGDIVTSMKRYYAISGGRVLAHSLVYFFLMFDKFFFNILNAFAFVLLGILIDRLSSTDPKACYVRKIVLIYVLMFLFLPSFGDTCLWLSGSINYLWMSLIPLLFLFFYSKDQYVLSFVFAFASGFTNEATSGMLLVYLVVERLLSKKKISKQFLLQIFLLLPGTLSVLLAPGNSSRAQSIEQTKLFDIETVFIMLGKNLQWLFVNGYLILIVIMAGLVIAFRKQQLKAFSCILPYLVSSVAGMGALALSGTFLARAHFLCIVFLLIAFVRSVCLANHIFAERLKDSESEKKPLNDKIKKYIRLGTVLVILCIAFLLIFNTITYVGATLSDQERIRTIEMKAKQGKDVSVAPDYHYDSGRFYPAEGSVSKGYEARWIGMYYDINFQYLQ